LYQKVRELALGGDRDAGRRNNATNGASLARFAGGGK
jgi:hypothetical protein